MGYHANPEKSVRESLGRVVVRNERLEAELAEVKSQLAESQQRERAFEAATRRHYNDMTSQCFICYSCINHDARCHWNGKEPYACSGCGKSHPKWRFDEGRFAQGGTK